MLWAGLLVFLSVAYFDNRHPNANVNSQFSLTCAIVERGTLAIDAYVMDPRFKTIDMAFFGGHVYCDKSPVTPFLGVPVFAAYRALARISGGTLNYDRARYWTTLLTAGVAAALLAAMTAAALMRRGVDPRRAALGGALWLAATPMLGYSILFYNYLPAGALMMGSYLCVAPLLENPEPHRPGRAFWGGLLMGLAAWTLNTCAIAALVMTAVLPLSAWGAAAGGRPWWRRAWSRLWPWALGGVLGAAGYFIYIHALFGTLASPYRFEVVPHFRKGMSQGLMGATRPRLLVAWLLTFHKFQGLFLWFPPTLLALAGAIWSATRRRGTRLANAAAALIFFLFLLYTSAYFMWWGGFAYAPRHLIPALPLLGLGLAPWLGARSAWPARALVTIAMATALFNAAAVAVDPQPDPFGDRPHDPLLADEQLMHPELMTEWPSPYLELQERFWQRSEVDKNLGVHLGIPDQLSLLPLTGLWGAAVTWLFWRRKTGTGAGPNPGDDRPGVF